MIRGSRTTTATYEGEMTKSQSNKAFNTAQNQQAQTSQNAQSSYNAAVGDIGDYKSSLAKYAAENPYVSGGSFETATNQRMADAAAGGAQGTQQAIQASMIRSGGNPGSAVAAGEEIARENARGQMDAQAKAEQDRAQGLANYNSGVLQATAKPEEMEADLMKDQLSSEQGALGSETDTAKTPSFWQQAGLAAIQGGAQVGAAFCPAEGSLYLMADGTEIPVERIRIGDQIRSIAGETETVELIERAMALVLRVETADGLTLRCSRVHAFALPSGGFIEAAKSLGKTVVVHKGSGRIVKVEPDGEARVYSVVTDGSHTYRANGFWSLGVGDAERQITMEEWNRIADKITIRATAEVL